MRYLGILAIVLALTAWLAGFGFVMGSMADIYHSDPATLAELRQQASVLLHLYMWLFLSLLVLSSWLAGLLAPQHRFLSWTVVVIHIVFVSAATIYSARV